MSIDAEIPMHTPPANGNVEYHCVVCERLTKMRNGDFEPIIFEAQYGVIEEGGTTNVDDEADPHNVVEDVGVGDLISKVDMDPQVDVAEVCKICSLGKRDNANVIVKCCHVDFHFNFYHVDYLKPRLKSPSHLNGTVVLAFVWLFSLTRGQSVLLSMMVVMKVIISTVSLLLCLNYQNGNGIAQSTLMHETKNKCKNKNEEYLNRLDCFMGNSNNGEFFFLWI